MSDRDLQKDFGPLLSPEESLEERLRHFGPLLSPEESARGRAYVEAHRPFDLIDQMERARTHTDSRLRDEWAIAERYDMYPHEIRALKETGAFKDPRCRRPGKPKGRKTHRLDDDRARELANRLANDETEADIWRDMLTRREGKPRIEGNGQDAQKKRRVLKAAADLGLNISQYFASD